MSDEQLSTISALVPFILSNGSVRWAIHDNFNNTRRKQAT